MSLLQRGHLIAMGRMGCRRMSTDSDRVTPSWVKPLFWAGIATSQVSTFFIFRDLADLSQMIVEPPRSSTIATWRYRNLYSAATLCPLGLGGLLKLAYPAVCSWPLFSAMSVWTGVLFFSGVINPHIMMRARNQKDHAVYVSQEDAIKLLPDGADEPCIILEVDGKAAAYPDSQALRPHVVNADEVSEDVVLTYCGLSNLGIAYTPKLGGKSLDLHPMTQMENNLVMYDKNSMEPVQQFWGTTESRMECQCGLGNVERMKEWPTYRLTFQNFCKAWPGSKVFVNDYSTQGLKPSFLGNPIQFIYDGMMDLIFKSSIVYQKTNEKPVFPTLKTKDNRLPNKENVYAVPLEGDDVAYTKAFVQEKKIINTTIGGRKVVVAYFPEFDAIGAFHNTTGQQVNHLDFYGRLKDGRKLPRVETFKAGCFWCVWINWFPQTDLNRI
ncbi:unnamed protein product [Effrenium voratum]|uniref:DUF3179 domain-containing protein n=1 Tax=Effrenium voratum TaxID=2562239 RepID=A0AA36MU22_9DINO|nr:unnamed protein product [Effrenium voratum]CAJ1431456.1 unnamed protein product [Effrenium voratum]